VQTCFAKNVPIVVVSEKDSSMGIKTKFSAAAAKITLGDQPIENTATSMAEAFIKILSDQGFEINAVEVKRWCEYQYKRRYQYYAQLKLGEEHKHTVSTIKPDYVIANFRTYMNNWYDEHRKWLRAMS